MNIIDIGILIIFGISCLAGLMRGFTREILGVFTWAGSIAATYIALPLVGGFARGHIANPVIADTITAIVLFIVFLILFSIVSSALANSVQRSSLGSVDRALGFFFGIIRSVVIVCAIEIILSTFTLRPNQPEAIQNARFTPLVHRGADSLIAWLPQELRTFIAKQQADSGAKNSQSASQNPRIKSIEGIIANDLNHIVAERIMEGQPKQFKNFLQSGSASEKTMPPSHKATSPDTEEDRDKIAESLAKLTPQAMELKTRDGDYNKRQRRELDRLIQINQ